MTPRHGVAAGPSPGRLATLAGLLAAGVLLGCGGGETPSGDSAGDGGPTGAETRTFENEDFDITFQYPRELEVSDDAAFGSSGESGPDAEAGVRLGRDDYFAVQRFTLNAEITHENLEQFTPEADALYRDLSGSDVTGEPTEVGGLPALRYEYAPRGSDDASSQAILFFDGATEYLFTCTSTPEHRDVIQAACETAVETLETTG